ncbi:MAG: chemotaxis protein CheD [Dehalococcoidia bacterium]
MSLGELLVARDPEDIIECHGLGSCLAICVIAPGAAIAGVAHTVLPSRNGSLWTEPNARFVEDAVPLLLQRMESLGAVRGRLQVKLVGGAEIVPMSGGDPRLLIGQRNIEAARTTLREHGVKIAGEHVGGSRGRRVRLEVGSGRLTVSMAGNVSYEL